MNKWIKTNWGKMWKWHNGTKFFIVKAQNQETKYGLGIPNGYQYGIFEAGAHRDGFALKCGYAKLFSNAKARAIAMEERRIKLSPDILENAS